MVLYTCTICEFPQTVGLVCLYAFVVKVSLKCLEKLMLKAWPLSLYNWKCTESHIMYTICEQSTKNSWCWMLYLKNSPPNYYRCGECPPGLVGDGKTCTGGKCPFVWHWAEVGDNNGGDIMRERWPKMTLVFLISKETLIHQDVTWRSVCLHERGWSTGKPVDYTVYITLNYQAKQWKAHVRLMGNLQSRSLALWTYNDTERRKVIFLMQSRIASHFSNHCIVWCLPKNLSNPHTLMKSIDAKCP